MMIHIPKEVTEQLASIGSLQHLYLQGPFDLELEESEEQFDFMDAPTILETELPGWNEYIFLAYDKEPDDREEVTFHRTVIHAFPNTGLIDKAKEGESYSLLEYLQSVALRIEAWKVSDDPDSEPMNYKVQVSVGSDPSDIEDGNYI